MALSTDEQDLFEEGRAILPPWFFSNERVNEELGEMAKLMGASLAQARDWLQTQVLITTANGATSTTPDWLNQHAIDRGTSRQSSETDAALRDRLRKFEDGIVRPTLLSAIQSMLTTYGIAGTAYMVELPRDEIFIGTVTANTGTGGVFTAPSGGSMTFKPTVRFRMPPFKRPFSTYDVNGQTVGSLTPVSGRVRSYQITISGAANSGNNGTFPTTGMVGDAVQYANGSGVGATDATVSWSVKRKDWQSTVLDGFRHSFLSRGDRIGRQGGEIVVILPYGTTAAAQASIAEMLRTKKGAGIALRVERRLNP